MVLLHALLILVVWGTGLLLARIAARVDPRSAIYAALLWIVFTTTLIDTDSLAANCELFMMLAARRVGRSVPRRADGPDRCARRCRDPVQVPGGDPAAALRARGDPREPQAAGDDRRARPRDRDRVRAADRRRGRLALRARCVGRRVVLVQVQLRLYRHRLVDREARADGRADRARGRRGRAAVLPRGPVVARSAPASRRDRSAGSRRARSRSSSAAGSSVTTSIRSPRRSPCSPHRARPRSPSATAARSSPRSPCPPRSSSRSPPRTIG